MTINLVLFGFLSSAILTGAMRFYSLKYNVLDIPVSRSSHDLPTPRGGGAAIVVSTLALFTYAGMSEIIEWPTVLSLIIPGFCVALAGFIDDHRHVSAPIRLAVHFFASALAIYLLPELPGIAFNSVEFSNPLLIYPLYIVALVWLLNLYNFMDGIDGIAGSEAISVLLAAAAIIFATNDSHWSSILLWTCGPVMGYLIWNWEPAKIFMGDAGSGFLGLVIGVLALSTSVNSVLTLWTWLILLGVFICDTTWTLVFRFKTGQDWHQPHHNHAYQILARKLNSHARTTLGVIGVNLVWLAPLAYLTTLHPKSGWWITLIAYSPLLFTCYRLGAGKSRIQNVKVNHQ